MRTIFIATIAAAVLAGCGDSVKDKIKQEGERFEFLVFNDGTKQEKCASMKRLRDLHAEAKNKRFYREWSDYINKEC